MSGIYIPGMGMPKRGHTVTVTIGGCEEVYVEYYDCRPHVEEDIKYKAVPVTDHGRLIDADKVMEALSDMAKEYPKNPLDSIGGYMISKVRVAIEKLPTIIPASGGKENEF